MARPPIHRLIGLLFRSLVTDVGSFAAVLRAGGLQSEPRHLRADGFVVREDYLPPDVCDKLREEVLAFVEGLDRSAGQPAGQDGMEIRLPVGAVVHLRDSFDGRERYDTGMVDVTGADRAIPAIAFYPEDSRLLELVEAASSRPFEVHNTNAYVNHGVGTTRVFHCDSVGAAQYKSFVYLSDVTDEADGPYCYVRGSHRFTLYRQLNLVWNWLRGYPMTDMRLYATRRVVKFTAKKGTLIVTNQNGFHRGWPQSPDSLRVVIVNNYTPRGQGG